MHLLGFFLVGTKIWFGCKEEEIMKAPNMKATCLKTWNLTHLIQMP